MVYMHFSKGLQGSKWAITITPVSIDLQKRLFVITSHIELPWFNKTRWGTKSRNLPQRNIKSSAVHYHGKKAKVEQKFHPLSISVDIEISLLLAWTGNIIR